MLPDLLVYLERGRARAAATTWGEPHTVCQKETSEAKGEKGKKREGNQRTEGNAIWESRSSAVAPSFHNIVHFFCGRGFPHPFHMNFPTSVLLLEFATFLSKAASKCLQALVQHGPVG
eukprot:1657965-Amphidinium_carterae.1